MKDDEGIIWDSLVLFLENRWKRLNLTVNCPLNKPMALC